QAMSTTTSAIRISQTRSISRLARSGNRRVKTSTVAWPRRSWHQGRKAKTAKAVSASTSAKSPGIGPSPWRVKTRPVMLATVSPVTERSASPPSTASARASHSTAAGSVFTLAASRLLLRLGVFRDQRAGLFDQRRPVEAAAVHLLDPAVDDGLGGVLPPGGGVGVEPQDGVAAIDRELARRPVIMLLRPAEQGGELPAGIV